MSDSKILQSILDIVSQLREDIKVIKEDIKGVNKRLDNLGLQIANLEDDLRRFEKVGPSTHLRHKGGEWFEP